MTPRGEIGARLIDAKLAAGDPQTGEAGGTGHQLLGLQPDAAGRQRPHRAIGTGLGSGGNEQPCRSSTAGDGHREAHGKKRRRFELEESDQQAVAIDERAVDGRRPFRGHVERRPQWNLVADDADGRAGLAQFLRPREAIADRLGHPRVELRDIDVGECGIVAKERCSERDAQRAERVS